MRNMTGNMESFSRLLCVGELRALSILVSILEEEEWEGNHGKTEEGCGRGSVSLLKMSARENRVPSYRST